MVPSGVPAIPPKYPPPCEPAAAGGPLTCGNAGGGSERGTRYSTLAPTPLCTSRGRRAVYLRKRRGWFRVGYPVFRPSTPPLVNRTQRPSEEGAPKSGEPSPAPAVWLRLPGTRYPTARVASHRPAPAARHPLPICRALRATLENRPQDATFGADILAEMSRSAGDSRNGPSGATSRSALAREGAVVRRGHWRGERTRWPAGPRAGRPGGGSEWGTRYSTQAPTPL